MITGLREFRKTLSKHVSYVRGGQIVIITEHERPIASLISTDKLRELAKKADDELIINELKQAQADRNKEFLERKDDFANEIERFLSLAKKGKGRVPDSTIDKLGSITSTIKNLISDEGTIEDQRMLALMIKISRSPLSRVLDYDYYYVHKDFLEAVKKEISILVKKTISKDKGQSVSKDLALLTRMVEGAVLRNKSKADERIGIGCSFLTEISKNGSFYSSRIYTAMPFWYEKPRSFNYFIDFSSSLGERFYNRKIGDSFEYGGFKYEVLSIT